MIDMRKYTSHSCKMLNSNQRGVVLIWLIFILVIAGILGSSMVYLTTSSTYDELLANNQARAYYMAEAGGRYVTPIMQQNPATAFTDINGNTFILSNGDQFMISNMNIINNPMTVVSTGIVNVGSWLEGQRTITYKVPKPFSDSFDNKNNWNDPGDNADIYNVNGNNALRVNKIADTTNGVTMDFDWWNDPGLPNLADIRSQNGGLLIYQLQLKIAVEVFGSKGDHYMLGLSFRLDTGVDPDDVLDDSSYGISFFKSDDRDAEPGFIRNLLSVPFDPIIINNSGDIYIVLWEKISGNYELLAYSNLMSTDLISGGELKNWSTIVVQITETNGGINSISGYIQAPDENVPNGIYPRGTISWDFGVFNPVTIWNVPDPVDPVNNPPIPTPQPIVDNTFTSAGFNSLPYPAEIGIHIFYDNPSNNVIFFDDLAMRFLRPDGRVLYIRPIQY